jgi:hypothetical protein
VPEAVELIAAALRGMGPEPCRALWPNLISCAHAQGVLPLLARASERAGWHRELCDQLAPQAAAATAHALLRRRELERVATAFSVARLPVFLIKGAHLELACYDAPGLRPRSDTDLLIRERDRSAVRRLLCAAGYVPARHVTGTVAFTQFHFVRNDDQGVVHPLDVHWRISNAMTFASRVGWSDCWEERTPAPGLAPGTFVPSLPLALMIACIHRVAHHYSSERLIWIHDIHQVAMRLDERQFGVMLKLAGNRGMLEVIASGLQAAVKHFATPLPEPVLRCIQHVHDADAEVRQFLDGTFGSIEVLLSDWRQLRGLALRLRFLREHLFPEADFIRSRYGISTPLVLPFLYAHRLAAGAFRRL